MVRIRIYGQDLPKLALETALKDHFDDVLLDEGDYSEDIQSTEVVQNDVLICFVRTDNIGAAIPFIGRVIGRHGVWTYLPIVVVGLPEDVADQHALFHLGAARYLSESASDKAIARTVKNVLQRTWWFGESGLALPVFVVDDQGIILRASEWAANQFGSDVVGQSYSFVVEERSAGLPDDHPIVVCMAERRVIGRDHKFPLKNGRDVRHFLHCSPIFSGQKLARSAAVLVIDTSRWETLAEAPTLLSRSNDPEHLYQQIVRLGESLGFRRVRLYQYLENGRTEKTKGKEVFKPLTSVGFGPETASAFVNEFEIPIDEDPPSAETIRSLKPRLYVQRPKYPVRESDIIRYFEDSPNYAERLNKEKVSRWIDAPIWIPGAVNGQAAPRPWGKFSIDPGPESEQLNENDVGDVALYCRVVADALADYKRRSTEQAIGVEVRSSSQALVSAVETGDLLPTVFERVLKLYQKITGADVVLYRHYDAKAPNPLRLIGWVYKDERKHELEQKWAIPGEFCFPAGVGEYFRFFRAVDPDTDPYVVEDACGMCGRLLEYDWARQLGDKECAYLRSIRSELHIPVFEGSRVAGVVVAASEAPNAFGEESLRGTIAGLMHLVSIWIDLARRHDGRRWAESVLTDCVRALSILAAVPLSDDHSFFAGLAALLSSHFGLCWNRALIYSCVRNDGRAELAYAVGGLVGENDQDHHRELQRAVFSDPRFQDLVSLVKYRVDNPVPHWCAEQGGRTIEDLLYAACVEKFGGPENRIVESYGRHLPADEATADGSPEQANPLRWLLSQDYSEAPRFEIPKIIADRPDQPCSWVRRMNETFPGIFNDSPVYAFPLWCASSASEQPVGVVLTDMQHWTEKRFEDIVAATRVVLGLAGDLLAYRAWNRRLRGRHRALREISHGTDLQCVWLNFWASLGDLAPDQSKWKEPGYTADIAKQIEFDTGARTLYSSLVDALSELNQKIQRLEQTDDAYIPSLGRHLRKILGEYQERYRDCLIVDEQCAPVDDVGLPCDELVLSDVIFGLIDNSITAAEKAGRNQVTVRVAAFTEPPGCSFFRQIVTIVVQDDGPGVDKAHRENLFIDGFTSANQHRRGRGLSTIRVQLSAYHGDLQYKPPASGEQGATFEIRFGIPNDPSTLRTGNRRDQTTGA